MMTTIAGGNGSRILEPRRMIVREAAAWRALWAAHAGPGTESPPVDFSTHIVAAVFAGERPSPGFEIEITGARPRGTALDVVVEERAPAPGTVAPQMVVTPFHIVLLPRHEGEVGFTPAGARRPSTSRPSSKSIGGTQAPSSTGLAPAFAAALAYLAGPFSGILVLLAERTNSFVRFHAWQSILALGGLGVLSVVFLIAAFAALLISPSAFTFMYWMAFLTALAWVILWAACLVQAYRARAWKLPLVGDIAERRARS